MVQPFLLNGTSPLHEALIMTALLILICCFWIVFNSERAGLRKIPGPFLARYTDAWGLYSAWSTNIAGDKVSFFRYLQTQYGDVIRTGPRTVAVVDPAAVPVIYGVRTKLNKSDAYVPFRQAGVTTSLLSIPDEKTHSQYRKLVSNAYSMSSLKGYEPYVDEMVNRFIEVCNEYVKSKEPMNISVWCNYYAFDVVSKITMGTPLGFLDGKDAYGLIERVKSFGRYTSVVSTMPWLHKIFQDNPIMRKTKPSPFMKVVQAAVTERLRNPDPEDQRRPDLLSHFVATHGSYPELMDPKQVLISASGNLIAGSLSPGKAFDELCQFLARNPDSQDKIYAELKQSHCTLPAAFDDVKDLPYLEGVIRESYRLHSSASFNLQRVTGPGGLKLPSGHHIPAGTKIGVPAGTINQDRGVFGSDAETYNPERWQQGKDESFESYEERRKLMDRTDMSFGQGSRTCIGKNVVALEIFKVVATIMGQFKFELVGEARKFEVFVTVHRREKSIASQ